LFSAIYCKNPPCLNISIANSFCLRAKALALSPTELILFFHQNKTVMEWIIYALLIGALSGWLAGQLFKGYGFGLIGNIIVGILGGIIGSYVLGALGVSFGGGTLGSIITSVIGAIVLLFVIGLFKKS
jgi:uncharacterized membrane protein YeaQ/YmgE (transglycosylase-associated protein family)